MEPALIILLGVIVVLLILAIAISATIFWIFMIVDSVKRSFKTDGEKIAWVLIIILLGILGALVYYFAVKRPNKEPSKKTTKKKMINKKSQSH